MAEHKNLIMARTPGSVWDRRPSMLQGYDHERWLTAALGTALAMVGGALAIRAALGRHDYRVARHWMHTALHERGWAGRDVVNDDAEASFPASDTPSFTADIGTARR
jgi:hypothetical protein